jgi:hypothetical protein
VIVALLARDLIITSKVAAAAARADADFQRFDDPSQLPPSAQVDLLLVDWGDRGSDWGELLAAWISAAPIVRPPRVILFGPHTDLAAHAAARAAGLVPMWARSKLLADLPSVVGSLAG